MPLFLDPYPLCTHQFQSHGAAFGKAASSTHGQERITCCQGPGKVLPLLKDTKLCPSVCHASVFPPGSGGDSHLGDWKVDHLRQLFPLSGDPRH